jgi:hypothetical protein
MTCCLCDSGATSESPSPKCKNTSCRICLNVANLDAEINRAVAALQLLLTKRCDLRSEQNKAHDIMHRLPLEIKNRIFELALPTRDKWGRGVQVGWPRGRTPSYLSSICRNWRDIAQSNPFLWSTIPMVLGAPSTSDPSWVGFVHDWIQRSRNSPLRLHISVFENDGSEDDMEEYEIEEQLNDVLDVMAQCPNEWQSLSLNIPSFFLNIFHDGDKDFKSRLLTVKKLQLLRARVCGRMDDIDEPVHPTMSPEMIEIEGFPFKSLPISWNHLTFAEVSRWDLEEIMQLFQHASQMTCCSILWPASAALCNAPDYPWNAANVALALLGLATFYKYPFSSIPSHFHVFAPSKQVSTTWLLHSSLHSSAGHPVP